MSKVLEKFEVVAARFPDKTALADREHRCTFGELRHRARCLAGMIQNMGLSGEPVAVFVDRGIDTAICFLAVLYSGNYYIPLDPDMPAEKRAKILKDSAARLILTPGTDRELPAQEGFAGRVATVSDAADEENIPVQTRESDPAYMIYTSGSTGTPKGVLKTHGAVWSFIETFADTFALTEQEVIGNQTPLFFDASAKDFYLMLYTGATLEILPSELFIFPIRLVEYMNQRAITYICWVPTALALVVQMKTFQKLLPKTLRNVFFVGEVFPQKQLNVWLETLPNLRYVNLYGSTEIAGIACFYELDPAKRSELLPMGKALANCRVFLMEDGAVVSDPGQAGEVCIASPALAEGYFHDPEKTAAAFVTHQGPDGSSERFLKTGDFAKYDEDGNLVFVTRKDFQIKHMGRRIELGEIEAVADTLEQVQRCCCLYNEKKKRIELFCETVPGCADAKKEILHQLRRKLTDYMVPSKVTVTDRLPYNANGKIDRVKLRQLM